MPKFSEIELPEIVTQSTIPLFGAFQGSPLIQDGTGVLLRILNRYFLITGRHVVQEHLNLKTAEYEEFRATYACIGSEAHHNIELRDDGTFPIGYKKISLLIDNNRDIAIIELSDETVARLAGKNFLSLEDISLVKSPKSGEFVVYGYPHSLSEDVAIGHKELLVKPHSCQFLATPIELTLPNFDRDHNVAFKYPDMDAFHDSIRTELAEEGFKGISGGGIWLIGRRGDGTVDERAKIIGIFLISAKADKYVAGTTFKSILDKLAEAYPELSEELSKVAIEEL